MYIFTFLMYYYLLNVEFMIIKKRHCSVTSYHNRCYVQRNFACSKSCV